MGERILDPRSAGFDESLSVEPSGFGELELAKKTDVASSGSAGFGRAG